jgi:6-pyruvoyltetrahydropterin/6-carboxytetrahydropterin synthase
MAESHSPDLIAYWLQFKQDGAMTSITSLRPHAIVARRRLFSSAHFYAQQRFSRDENLQHFGRCYTAYGHGHNYVLEAFIEGPIDPDTRLVMNLSDLDHLLWKVTDPLDHHHLNFDIQEFKEKVPTTENIALYLKRELEKELQLSHPKLKLNRLRLFETDDLWVEII